MAREDGLEEDRVALLEAEAAAAVETEPPRRVRRL